MVRYVQPTATTRPADGPDQTPAAGGRPTEAADVADSVGHLLRDGCPRRGLDLLARFDAVSPWAANAKGVCLLRLGDIRQAIEVFRGLVLGSGGLVLRTDVPTVFKTNFATALLVDGNVAGCMSVLSEIREEGHPTVRKLRAAIRRWQEGMSFWERVWCHLGSPPDRAVDLGFDPGEL